MLKNKVDFFFYKQAYQTILNTALLEHHFSFDKHYVPTKLGRSTLRRADYITLNKAYNYTSKRPFMMIVYIINNLKSSQSIQLSLNNDLYNLAFEELYVFEIPENTKIAFNSHNQVNIILFEYDDILTPDKPSLINMASENSQTNLEIININNNHLCKSHDKPFFVYILNGNLTIEDKNLVKYDAFYGNYDINIIGNGKILIFSMPVPL